MIQEIADALNADQGAIGRLFGPLQPHTVYCLVFQDEADALRAARGEAPLVAPRRRQASPAVVAAQGGGSLMTRLALAVQPDQALVALCRGGGEGFTPIICNVITLQAVGE